MDETTKRERLRAPSLLLCLALAPVAPAAAQETWFHPELFLEQAYNSNLLTQPGGEAVGDGITRVGVGLPVSRSWRGGSLLFRYQPSYEWYRDHDDLNHDEHRIRLGVTAEPGRRSALSCGLAWERTQSQGTVEDPELGDTVLVPRSERDLVHSHLRYEGNFGRRMSWRGGVEASRSAHTLLEDPEADPTTRGIEDRSQYAGLLGVDREVSRRDRLGFEARWDYYDLEFTGAERVAQLSFTWSRAVPESYEASLHIGGFRREDLPGENDVPLAPDEESGVTFAARVARLLPRSRLDLSATHVPSAGGSLVGTSTNMAVALAWSGSAGRRWDWALSSTYTRRAPTAPDGFDSETLGGAGRLEWRTGRRAALRLAASYTEQATDDPALDAAVWTGALGFVWLPRGAGRASGAGR